MSNSVHADISTSLLADAPLMLTVKEAAALLRSTRRSVSRWIADGSIAAHKLSPGRAGKVLIPRQALAQFLNEHTV